jgi:hypothetical protein
MVGFRNSDGPIALRKELIYLLAIYGNVVNSSLFVTARTTWRHGKTK